MEKGRGDTSWTIGERTRRGAMHTAMVEGVGDCVHGPKRESGALQWHWMRWSPPASSAMESGGVCQCLVSAGIKCDGVWRATMALDAMESTGVKCDGVWHATMALDAMESAGVKCDGVWRATTALDAMESAGVKCNGIWWSPPVSGVRRDQVRWSSLGLSLADCSTQKWQWHDDLQLSRHTV